MNEYLTHLKDLVALKSISTDSVYQPEIHKTVSWLVDYFARAGLTTDTITGYGNPLVLACTPHDATKETILVYGHYDVQPAEIADGWEGDPFVLRQTDTRLIGRGVADNKGQTLIVMEAVRELLKANQLGYNIIFLLDGDEETGSEKLDQYIPILLNQHKVDCVMISDGPLAQNKPTTWTGFRGSMKAKIEIRTLERDGHSGLYGGVVPAAPHVASQLVQSFFSVEPHIAIQGWYDNVINHHTEEVVDEKEFLKLAGAPYTFTEPNISLEDQFSTRPALIVTGLSSGYVGSGFKSIVPASAAININIRLVEGQKPLDLGQKLRDHISNTLDSRIQWELSLDQVGEAVVLSTDHSFMGKARAILQEVYGEAPQQVYVGGSIPVVKMFADANIPQVLVPLCNDDCYIHGPEENMTVAAVVKGLDFAKRFLASTG